MTSPSPHQGFCCFIFLSLQYQARVPTCGVDPKSNQSSVVTFLTVITFHSKSLPQTLGEVLLSTVGIPQLFRVPCPVGAQLKETTCCPFQGTFKVRITEGLFKSMVEEEIAHAKAGCHMPPINHTK